MNEDWCRQIERRIQTLETFAAVEEVHRINVENRLASIEDLLKWLVRLVIGALLLAALAYAVKGGLTIV